MDDEQKVPHSPIPIRKSVDSARDREPAYEFKVQFNAQAQLVNIDYPENLSVAQVNHHFAVAMLFLAQEIVKEKTRQGAG